MRYIGVRNYHLFQTHRDRSPAWIKLYTSILENYDFLKLSEIAQCHLMKIWALASRLSNRIPYDEVWITKAIHAKKRVCVADLIYAGWLEELPAQQSDASAQPEELRSEQSAQQFDASAQPQELRRSISAQPHDPYAQFSAQLGDDEQVTRYVADDVRERVLDRDARQCVQCHATEGLEISRIVPASKGGSGDESNLQTLCRSCGRKRRATSWQQTATQELRSFSDLRTLEREGETETEKREREILLLDDATTQIADADPLALHTTQHALAQRGVVLSDVAPAAAGTRTELPAIIGPRNFAAIREQLATVLSEVAHGTRKRITKEQARRLLAGVVVGYWMAKYNHPKALVDAKRERIVMKALEDNGDNLDELLYALDGATRDAYVNGEKDSTKHDEIEFLLRNRGNVERFANLSKRYQRGEPHPTAEKYKAILAGGAPLNGNGVHHE